MLSKLLKYDLKSMGKSLLVPYAGILILAVILRLLGLLTEQFSILQVLTMPITIIFYILMIGSFFYTFFISIKRFYKNIFKDEGYLTNTLPIKKSSILLSKIISSTILIIINFLVVVAALWIVGLFDIFNAIINSLVLQMQLSKGLSLSIFLGLMLLSYMNMLFLFFSALTIGHAHYKDKLPYSILAGVVVYMANQFVTLIAMIPFLIMNKEVFTNPNVVIAPNSLNIMIISTFAITMICLFAYYFIMKYVLNKKFNID